jgi:hypothetical protein
VARLRLPAVERTQALTADYAEGEGVEVRGVGATLLLPREAQPGRAPATLALFVRRREAASDGCFRHEPPVDAPSPRHITGRALRDTWSQRRRERRPYAGGVPARGPPTMVSELDEWFHVEKLRLAPLTR